MTMHTVYLKEHEGIIQNPTGQSSLASVPWLSGLGSQLGYAESLGQFRLSSLEHPANGGQLSTTKQVERGAEQRLEKGNTAQFTIFPGGCKTSANVPMQSAPPEYRGHFELGFGQSVVCAAKYPYGDHCYGVFPAYGPHTVGRIMLPLSLTLDDGPIYVNAKQYRGIIRRRLSRAKAESENKVTRNRKPYLHLSRHLHAMRRPRGNGGRFLNTKTSSDGKSESEKEMTAGNGQFSQATESQNSEVLESDSGNLNSPKEANGNRSNVSGSEVTSMFSKGDLDRFTLSPLWPSVLSLSDMNTGHGMVMPSKWIAAADGAATPRCGR